MIHLNKFVITGVLISIIMSGCIGLNGKTQSVQENTDVQEVAAPVETQSVKEMPEVQVVNSTESIPAQKMPEVQVINMSVDEKGWTPNSFILQKGVKVEWVINVKKLTNCNNEIIVKDYGLDIKLKNGENIVEFTPDKEGTVKWSCWMGMIPGTFIVN
jgi:PBP1b-binding outer membrane lipoprotein LpoB